MRLAASACEAIGHPRGAESSARRPAPRRRRRIHVSAAVVVLMFGTLGSIGTQGAGSASAAGCSDSEVVFARGTNEAPGVGEIGQDFVDALTPRLQGKTMNVYGVDYPASYEFSRGVEGVIDATQRIESIAANCPHTKIILGGYSQGAAVAGYTLTDAFPPGFVLPPGLVGPLPPSLASHVAAVVMFGTPKPWVVNLLAREAPPMNIAPAYADRTLQLCALGDPVCNDGGLDRAAHHAYTTNGMIDQAADFAAQAI